MKTAYWLPLLAVAAFAGDCDEDIFGTDTETDTAATFEFIINSASVTCATGTPDTVTARIEFGAWAETVTLDILETGDPNFPGNVAAVWDETHVFPAGPPPNGANIESAEDGSLDIWELTLDDVALPNDVTLGSTTLFDCSFYNTDGSGDASDNTYDSLAFRFSATPDDTTQDDQCAIFGHRSAEVAGWGTCECFEAFLNPVPADPCDAGN